MFKFIFLHLYVFADTAAEARLIVGSGWRRFLAFHSLLLLLPLSRIFTNIETQVLKQIQPQVLNQIQTQVLKPMQDIQKQILSQIKYKDIQPRHRK